MPKKSSELMAVEVLDSITNAIQGAGSVALGIQQRNKQAKIQQEQFQMTKEKFEMAKEKFRMQKIDDVYKNVERAWEFGGYDPISGKQIKPEESNRALKRKILEENAAQKKIRTEEAKVKLMKLRQEGKDKKLQKLPAKVEELILNANKLPNLMRNVGDIVKGNKDVFGWYSGGVKSSFLGRAIGEVADTFGKEEYIEEHNRAAALNSRLQSAVAEYLKATQGSRPTDFDWKIFEKMMPQISDRPELAVKKVNMIHKAYVDAYNSDRDKLLKRGYSEESVGPSLQYTPIADEPDFSSSDYLKE